MTLSRPFLEIKLNLGYGLSGIPFRRFRNGYPNKDRYLKVGL